MLIRAHRHLFAPGEEDLPALVVYSTDPFFDARIDVLMGLAQQVCLLRTLTPDTAPFSTLASKIADDAPPFFHYALPERLTGGREVFLSSLMVHRSFLPVRHLVLGWFPILIAPPATPVPMLLPLATLPEPLCSHWQLVSEDPTAALRTRYLTRPLTITPRAAARLRQQLLQTGKSPGRVVLQACLGDGVHVALEMVDKPDPLATLTHAEQIRLAVLPEALRACYGRIIEFDETDTHLTLLPALKKTRLWVEG
jgi:Fe-S cluster assembly iron-binding protein IscA